MSTIRVRGHRISVFEAVTREQTSVIESVHIRATEPGVECCRVGRREKEDFGTTCSEVYHGTQMDLYGGSIPVVDCDVTGADTGYSV